MKLIKKDAVATGIKKILLRNTGSTRKLGIWSKIDSLFVFLEIVCRIGIEEYFHIGIKEHLMK